jgi:hypothetical protein
MRVQTIPSRCNLVSHDTSNAIRELRTPAIHALRQSCLTLSELCDFLLLKLEKQLPKVKQDRIQIELYQQQYQEEEEEAVDYINDASDEEMAENDEEWD